VTETASGLYKVLHQFQKWVILWAR